VVCRFATKNKEWAIGANGLGFAEDGTMYVCNFGDAQLIAVKFDKQGGVKSQKVVAEGDPMKSTDGLKVCPKTGLVYIADFLGNAVHSVCPKTGKVTVIAKNGLTDGKNGELDKCSEVCLRGNRIYVANIDLNLDGNTFDKPYTISVIDLSR
jgi:sugar lactone lactonase YvrE